MGTKFTYALVLTIVMAVFSLLMFFTGYQTEKLATGKYLNYLGLPIMAFVLYLGIKAVREEKPGQYMTYGQAVGTGTVISLLSGLMSGVYTFIHFKFVNTSFADYQMEIIRNDWAKHGLSESQMEKMEPMTRIFLSPGAQLFMTPLFVTIIGLVLSLILAAFLKRPAPPGVEVPPPVPTA